MAARPDVGKPGALLRSDVRLLDDMSPFIQLGAQKGGEFIGPGADHHDAALFELSSDCRLCEGRDRIVVNFPDDVPRRLAGTNNADHEDTSTPATPASAMVGRSGATDSRLALATAGARSWPVVSRIFRTFGWLSGTRPWLTR